MFNYFFNPSIPRRFKDIFKLNQKSPLTASWIELISIGVIISLLTNKATNMRVFIHNFNKEVFIIYYYMLYFLIMFFGVLLIYYYLNWLRRFKIIDMEWEIVINNKGTVQDSYIIRNLREEIDNYLHHWLRYITLICFICIFFLCDFDLINSKNIVCPSLTGASIFGVSLFIMGIIIEIDTFYLISIKKVLYRDQGDLSDGLRFHYSDK